MKKLLIGLCICFLAACNNASKEEVAIVENDKGVVAVENDKKSVTNMENKKDVERVYYEMNSCGAVEKAVLAGDTQAVKRLLVAGAEEGDKFCALHSVIEQGFIDPARVNIEIVKLLLNAHTNVNARLILPTDFIDNSLLEKATLQRSAPLVQLLLAAGASMESKDRALSLAIREDYV